MTDIPFDPVGGSHIPNFQDLKPFQQRNSLMLGDVNFCVVCGNRTKFDRGTAKSFIKTCSPDHSNIIRKKNLDAAMIKKYGVKSAMQVPHIVNLIDRDAVQEKRLATIKRNGGWTFINTPKSIAKTKQTNIQKYGVDCIFKMPYVKDAAIKNAHTPSANAKRNATNISRYGAVTVLATQDCIAKTIPLSHSDSANAKRKITMQKRFGGGSPFCDDRVCDKRRQTMISKYGVQNVGELTRLNDDIVDQMQKLYADGLTDGAIAQQLGIGQSTVSTYLRKLGCVPFQAMVTKPQIIVENMICSINPDIIVARNDRTILKPFEIDVFIPDYKVGIELNGAYWHNETYKNATGHNSHYNKFKLAQNAGIRLLQIFDYELDDRHLNILKNILSFQINGFTSIGARKTVCKVVSTKEANNFLQSYHWQGSVGSSVKLGLYHDGKLVQMATFGKARFHKMSWELLRVATCPGYAIMGGLEKLINEFKNCIHCDRIVTYSDNRLFSGQSFANAGFNKERDNQIGYVWWNKHNGEVLSRYKTTKKKLYRESPDVKHMSEIDIMHQKGFARIFDAGQTRWILSNDT